MPSGQMRQWGRLGMVGESRAPNGIFRMSDHLGVGEGQRYPRSRVMPVEGSLGGHPKPAIEGHFKTGQR